jgi:hypothetical protein
MNEITTNAWRIRVSQKILGETVDTVPAEIRLGTGRSGGTVPPAATDTNLQTPVITGIVPSVVRTGELITITAIVTGGATGYSITEAGVFTADGGAIILTSFLPVSLATGITQQFVFQLYPEV